MDELHPRACIANARFIYASEGAHLRGKLRYFQYRDDRHEHIPQRGARRWMDRGLGASYGRIQNTCEALATTSLKKNVSARTLVISPEVAFMEALPEDRREPVLAELTDLTLERWFDAMELPTPEYSYVMHRGQSKAERPDGREKDVPGEREFLHSHVVLAATVPGLEQAREKYWVGQRQMPLLHAAARESMSELWTRELGQERVQELDHDLRERTQRLEDLDREHEIDEAVRLLQVGPNLEWDIPNNPNDLAAWFPRDEPPDRNDDFDLEW